jgi:peptide/nickel transport system substrate-binding protein
MVSREVVGHVPELEPRQPDLARARALLAAAGYPAGLDLVLETTGTPVTAAVAEQLARAGIRVRQEIRAWSELYKRLEAGDVGFASGVVLVPSGDAGELFYDKVHSWNPEAGLGGSNLSRYSNPELDQLIEASAVQSNPGERRWVLQQAMRMLMDDLPFVPLYATQRLYALAPDIAWVPPLDGTLRAVDMVRRAPSAP